MTWRKLAAPGTSLDHSLRDKAVAAPGRVATRSLLAPLDANAGSIGPGVGFRRRRHGRGRPDVAQAAVQAVEK